MLKQKHLLGMTNALCITFLQSQVHIYKFVLWVHNNTFLILVENICVPTEYNFTDMYRDPSLKTRNITLETIDDAVKTLKMLVGVDEVGLHFIFQY